MTQDALSLCVITELNQPTLATLSLKQEPLVLTLEKRYYALYLAVKKLTMQNYYSKQTVPKGPTILKTRWLTVIAEIFFLFYLLKNRAPNGKSHVCP